MIVRPAQDDPNASKVLDVPTNRNSPLEAARVNKMGHFSFLNALRILFVTNVKFSKLCADNNLKQEDTISGKD